jgi:hypothetical protein
LEDPSQRHTIHIGESSLLSIRDISFSQDARLLAISTEKEIRIYDVATFP